MRSIFCELLVAGATARVVESVVLANMLPHGGARFDGAAPPVIDAMPVLMAAPIGANGDVCYVRVT